mgnify:CR=1 FL=1
MTHKVLIAALLALGLSTGQAGEDSGKEPLVLNDEEPSLVKLTVDIRARYEYGDQEFNAAGPLRSSNAATWRNRFGLLTKEINGFQAFAEYEGTLVADKSAYRAASVSGPPNRTIIADPESHELNQAWLSYVTPSEEFRIKGGRQAISLDGQRYVGGVAWRQNMQTFDAASVTWALTSDLELYYGYVWRVNRIFGSGVSFAPQRDFKGNTHLINAKYKGLPIGDLTTYVYSMDLKTPGSSANSNDSFGFSLTGPLFDSAVNYYAEYAHQVNGSGNPVSYNANYAHGTLSTDIWDGIKGTLGIEYLGSDNGVGYNFPLGTNHKFNGFADRFLATPVAGLNDLYASIGTKLDCGVNIAGIYHYFWDDGFDMSFGQEIDAVASKDLGNGFTILGKTAFFFGQNTQPDLTRASIEIDFKY